MAEDDIDTDEDGEEEASPKKSNNKLKLFLIIGILLINAGGAGAYFYLNGKSSGVEVANAEEGDEEEADEEEEEEEAEMPTTPYYFTLNPPFVVNFIGSGSASFLQVNIEGLTRNPSIKEDITTHMPHIRNNIVMLLSSQKYDDLITPEGKETLRKAVLAELKSILRKETDKDEIEDVYFTSFVMQ